LNFPNQVIPDNPDDHQSNLRLDADRLSQETQAFLPIDVR
jgi:hypothetical protein